MARHFRAEDEGKRVTMADGETVGTVARTSGSVAYVRPDGELGTGVRQRLGWSEGDQDTFRLERSDVARLTDDEVHLSNRM